MKPTPSPSHGIELGVELFADLPRTLPEPELPLLPMTILGRDSVDSLQLIDELVYDVLDVKCIVAGGCWAYMLAGKKPNDIDVFFWDKAELSQAINQYSEVAVKTFENEHVINWMYKKHKVQFIKQYFYTSFNSIFHAFDFTIVKAAYNGSVFCCHSRFFVDLYGKKLVVEENLIKPLSALSRAFKYVARGNTICPVGIARIAKAIHSETIDWDDPDQNQIEFYPDGTPKFMGLD
jgi:hypothetical protein